MRQKVKPLSNLYSLWNFKILYTFSSVLYIYGFKHLNEKEKNKHKSAKRCIVKLIVKKFLDFYSYSWLTRSMAM